MEPASPARLYATAVGALLVILGIVGFFYGSEFGSPGTLDHTLGALRTNGWMDLLWAALGAIGLLTAGSFSRAYALGAGLFQKPVALPCGLRTTLVRWREHSGQRIPTGVGVMHSGQIGRPQELQETPVSRFGCR